ncbi:MAG: hypothetical protein MJE68_29895 [Proteobacteria bacterium]|nr:hypothetical protein [Pseudomonadota bacterium]
METPPLTPRVADGGGSSPPGVLTPHVQASAAEEDPPPLPPRLMDDGASTPHSADQSTPHQVTSDNGAGDLTYASVLARTPHTVPGSADPHTHTSPAAENSADDPPGRPPEECPPPLPPRLMDDGASTPHSADQSTPHQVTSDNGPDDPTYASILTTTPHAVSQPAATEKVSYEDIQKYQNEQVWPMVFHTSVVGYVIIMWYPT